MDVALETAMSYLEQTGQVSEFPKVQRMAATAIVAAWKTGEKNRIRLANIAIRTVEREHRIAL
jgi:hypothetical protein